MAFLAVLMGAAVQLHLHGAISQLSEHDATKAVGCPMLPLFPPSHHPP